MNMAINGKIRNYIFMGVVCLAFLSIIIGMSAAAQQNKIFQAEYLSYQQANYLMKQGQYAQASERLQGLDPRSQETYQVQYLLGVCSAAIGNTDEAVRYMQRVQEIKPAIVTEPTFLVEFGHILYLNGEYDLARKYILQSKKYETEPELDEHAEQILILINSKL